MDGFDRRQHKIGVSVQLPDQADGAADVAAQFFIIYKAVVKILMIIAEKRKPSTISLF